MKKKIVIIISIFIVLLLCIIIGIFFINKDYTNKQIDNLSDQYNELYNYLNKHEIINEGVIDVNANYRGAHGENYPNSFHFSFIRDNNNYKFSNESGYIDYEYDNPIYDILESIKEIKPSDLKKSLQQAKIDGEKLIVNTNNLNKNIKNISVLFKSQGIIKSLKYTEIIIDDIKINITDNNITINYFNNTINIKTNSSGYYLNINDKLKMNAFLANDKNTYSAVLDDKVLGIVVSNNNFQVSGLSPSAIYNSIELNIKKSDALINDSNLLDIESVPMLRYFTNIDLSFWNK